MLSSIGGWPPTTLCQPVSIAFTTTWLSQICPYLTQRLTSFSCKSGVNFTNILCAAFVRTDSKSAKKYHQTISLFMLLGSEQVKAAFENVCEIDPRLLMTGVIYQVC
jgi:hypothetical protein